MAGGEPQIASLQTHRRASVWVLGMVAFALLSSVLPVRPADASFPGFNGLIAFTN